MKSGSASENSVSIQEIQSIADLGGFADRWNRLAGHRFDRSLAWLIGWFQELPESNRRLAVYLASRGQEIIGILPMVLSTIDPEIRGPMQTAGMGQTCKGEILELLGCRGCFWEAKGILAAEQDQESCGELFAKHIAQTLLLSPFDNNGGPKNTVRKKNSDATKQPDTTRVQSAQWRGIARCDLGMRAFAETLMAIDPDRVKLNEENPSSYRFRVQIGPDGKPIWPLAARRPIKLARQGLASGVFQVVKAREKEGIVKNILELRSLLKNDDSSLSETFGAIRMVQQIVNARWYPVDWMEDLVRDGISRESFMRGSLGSLMVYWRGKPIAGAVFVDQGLSRSVIWMEVRVHPEQQQLVFWMLLSELIASGSEQNIPEINLYSELAALATGFVNHPPQVYSVVWNPPALSESTQVQSNQSKFSKIR